MRVCNKKDKEWKIQNRKQTWNVDYGARRRKKIFAFICVSNELKKDRYFFYFMHSFGCTSFDDLTYMLFFEFNFY